MTQWKTHLPSWSRENMLVLFVPVPLDNFPSMRLSEGSRILVNWHKEMQEILITHNREDSTQMLQPYMPPPPLLFFLILLYNLTHPKRLKPMISHPIPYCQGPHAHTQSIGNFLNGPNHHVYIIEAIFQAWLCMCFNIRFWKC